MNRAHLRCQINRYNHLLNKNKGQYYQELVKENSDDGKKAVASIEQGQVPGLYPSILYR